MALMDVKVSPTIGQDRLPGWGQSRHQNHLSRHRSHSAPGQSHNRFLFCPDFFDRLSLRAGKRQHNRHQLVNARSPQRYSFPRAYTESMKSRVYDAGN